MSEPASEPSPGEVTRLLVAWRTGDETALDRLFPLVYAELRMRAERLIAKERPGHTLQPTALVHEAYLKLAAGDTADLKDRAHFLGVAARAMRQLLVDYARRRGAAKRGAGAVAIELDDQIAGAELPFEELLSLNDALDRLAQVNDRWRQVVEYRFFGGLTEDEVAELMGVTPRTAQRDWVKARAWLYKELYHSSA